MQLLRKFLCLDPRRRRAVGAVVALSAPVRLVARVASFDRARRVAHALAPRLAGPFTGAADATEEIAWALAAARLGIPTGRSCVAESIVAEALARASGLRASVVFGFRRDETGALKGHAWAQTAGGPLGNPAEAAPFPLAMRVPDRAERGSGARRSP